MAKYSIFVGITWLGIVAFGIAAILWVTRDFLIDSKNIKYNCSVIEISPKEYPIEVREHCRFLKLRKRLIENEN